MHNNRDRLAQGIAAVGTFAPMTSLMNGSSPFVVPEASWTSADSMSSPPIPHSQSLKLGIVCARPFYLPRVQEIKEPLLVVSVPGLSLIVVTPFDLAITKRDIPLHF